MFPLLFGGGGGGAKSLANPTVLVEESPPADENDDSDDEIGSVPSDNASGTGGWGDVCLLRGLNVARNGCQMRLLLLSLLLSVEDKLAVVAGLPSDDDSAELVADLVGSGGGKPSNLNGGGN